MSQAAKPTLPLMLRRLAVGAGAVAVAFGLGLTSQAQAQNSCAGIRSELAALHNSGGGARTAQLRDAFNQQAQQLSRAHSAYERYQCSFGASPQCGSIVATINQMEGNLRQMERQLARVGGGGDPRRVAELERIFATQCGPNQQRQQQVRQQAQPNSLLEAIFGIRSQPGQRQQQVAMARPGQRDPRGFDRPGEVIREDQPRLRGNTFRTMCVRTSDGFYWPISFSTTRDRFDEDRSACAAMCPGTSVELYAYPNPGGSVEGMMNTLTTEPYSEQEFAFAYREDFNPDNRCTPSASVLEDLRASVSTGIAPVASNPRVPQPSPRPDMASDPETRALGDDGASFTALGAMTRPREDGQTAVRQVGPSHGYFAN